MQEQKPFPEFLRRWASRWDPTSQKLMAENCGLQPGERGFKQKCCNFLLWVAEQYECPAFIDPETAYRWVKQERCPDGWLFAFQLLDKNLSNSKN